MSRQPLPSRLGTIRPLLILAVASLSGAAGAAPVQVQSTDEVTAERLSREGATARQDGRVDEAITALSRSDALRPADADTQLQLGLAMFAKGRFEEAGGTFRKVLAAAPDYDDARAGLVRVSLATRDLDGAERELATLKRRSPNDPDVKGLEVQLAAARKPPPEAGTGLRSNTDATPGPETGRTESRRLFADGQAARKAGRFDEAVARFSTVVALDPGDVDAQVELGLALLARQRFAEARAAFVRALARTPDYSDARLGLARILDGNWWVRHRAGEALVKLGDFGIGALQEKSP